MPKLLFIFGEVLLWFANKGVYIALIMALCYFIDKRDNEKSAQIKELKQQNRYIDSCYQYNKQKYENLMLYLKKN